MINELKQYPKAFAECNTFVFTKYGISLETIADLYEDCCTNLETILYQGTIIEWLDSKGIFVCIDADVVFDTDDLCWSYLLYSTREYDLMNRDDYDGNFSTRTEATTQGIIRAFQILEEKM